MVGGEQAIANHYSLVSAADSPEKDPKSWTLYGSNDNEEWVAIDIQKNQVFSARKEKRKEFLLNNKKEYLYYKLEVTENGGSNTLK